MKRGNNVKYVLQDEIEGYGHFNNEKILIVDDNDTNLFVVKTILEDRGLIVDTALSGSEGIARFKHSGENEYRIVFLDINMYDMNGYEVSKKIRVLSRNDAEKVPIYALSANIFAKDRNKAKDSGMNGYVTKPINYKELFSLISETIKEQDEIFDEDTIGKNVINEKTDYDEKNKNYILDNLGQHFVFNALNTIKGAVITGSENTCSMINDLSDYMQYRLNTLRDDNRTVSLMEEIRHLKAYTRLEMARFSYIDIDIKEVPEKIKDYQIPAMSLMFIVKNSIKHGVRPLKNDMGKKAEVKVTAEAVDYGAEIYIEDNGIGFEKQNTKFLEEFGGLSYTKYRLMKLCHSEFVIESKKGMGTRVRILLEDMEECI